MHWLLLLALIIIIAIVVYDCSKKENFTSQEGIQGTKVNHSTLAEEESLQKITDYAGYGLVCLCICCLLCCSCSMYFIFVGASSAGKGTDK